MNIPSIRNEIDKLVRRNRVFYRFRMSYHDAMQNDLEKLALEYELIGHKEYPVPIGFIDIVWKDKQGNPVLAIEIDSSIRMKSVEKLSALRKEINRIWICYSPKKINIKEYENMIGGSVMKYEFKFQRNHKRYNN